MDEARLWQIKSPYALHKTDRFFGQRCHLERSHSPPSPVTLSPFAVILSAAKNLALLRVNSAKNLLDPRFRGGDSVGGGLVTPPPPVRHSRESESTPQAIRNAPPFRAAHAGLKPGATQTRTLPAFAVLGGRARCGV
jgi:hypothetical protein